MIKDFKLIDLGYATVRQEDLDEIRDFYDQVRVGHGSESESALDDLLHTLQVESYNVGGLEGRIKDVWNPEPEADTDRSYTLILLFNA